MKKTSKTGVKSRSEAFRLMDEGMSACEAARDLGLPESTVRRWRNQRALAHQPAADDAKDMHISALQEKVRQLETSRVQVIPQYQPAPSSSASERWKLAEADNTEHISKTLLQAKFEAQLPNEVCAVTFVSDQHIALGNCVDLKRMREDAELIASTDGLYAVLGGDGTDNHIKHRAAVLAARSQPQEQYELFEWYLSIFAHRVLVAISGNHDLWTNQIAGLDVMGMLCKQQHVCYAPDEAVIALRVGEQPYRVGMRHQYRMNSTFNETHAVKQWFRNGEHDWDIGCIGHHHVGCIEPFYGHGIERWACRPGSYQISSAYSRQFGYNCTRPTCPTFILYPDKRKIVGFHQLEDAVLHLSGVRNQ